MNNFPPASPPLSPQQLVTDSDYVMKQPSQPGRPPFQPPFARGGLVPRQRHSLPQTSDRAWDAVISRQACNETTWGIIQDAADLAQKMKQDSAYAAALFRRVSGLIRSPIRLTPANASDEARELTILCGKLIRDMLPEIELSRFIEWYHQLDTSFGTLEWEYDFVHAVMKPKLMSLNPRYAWYDVSRSTWVFPSWEGNADVTAGDGRWVLASIWRYGDWAGAVSRLAGDWIAKQYASRDMQEWSDFAAWPIIIAEVPAGGSDTDQQKQQFGAEVDAARTTRVITVYKSSEPGSSYGVSKLEIGGDDGWQLMKERIDMSDRKYLIYFLGGNMSEIMDQGARAAAQVHSAAERELIKGDAAKLSPVLREQVLLPFCVENGYDASIVPNIHFDVALADELEHRAQGFMNFANFLAKIPQGYVIDNVQEIAQDFGIRIRQVSDTLGAPADKITVSTQGTPEPGQGSEGPDAAGQVDADSPENIPDQPAKDDSPKKRSIKKIGPSRWRVYDIAGKNMGTFSVLKDAQDFRSHPR